jgi:hypothetical protein
VSALVAARRLVIAIVGVYVLTSLSLGGTAAARPVFYTLALSSAALVLAWSLFRRRGGDASPRIAIRGLAWQRGLEIVAANIAFTLLLAECSLRLYATCAGTSLLVSESLAAHRLTPGQDYGRGLRGNSLGYPGPDFVRAKRPGVFRIAALGDSFAVGPVVAWEENYLTRLEKQLPATEIYNFGVSGTGPREYALVLRQDVWQFQPDLVLLSVFVGNDITETMATPRRLDPRQHAVYLLLTRGWRLARAPGSPAPGTDPAVPPLSEAAFRAIEARRLAVCLDPPPPGLERKWQQALRYLSRVVDDCRDHGVPLAVVLIPDEFQINPDVLELARSEANVARHAVDLAGPQRRLARFFSERAVPCLDLQPALAATSGTYALRDTHWNRRGNELAAEDIATWLPQFVEQASRLPCDGRLEACPTTRPRPASGPLRPAP